jgi:hypothetical protein
MTITAEPATVTLVKLNNTPILTVQPGHITVHIVPLTTKAEVREFIQALEKAAEDAGAAGEEGKSVIRYL